MMKQIYTCNICSDMVPLLELFGCKFNGMKLFQLDGPKSTDGTHICHNCARQIYEQFAMALAEAQK